MLQVTRRPGEDILIATEQGLICVKICFIKNSQVAVGVNAPKEVAIYRREVLDRLLIDADFEPNETISNPEKLKEALSFLKKQYEIDKKVNSIR